jgi:hypothetical protein
MLPMRPPVAASGRSSGDQGAKSAAARAIGWCDGMLTDVASISPAPGAQHQRIGVLPPIDTRQDLAGLTMGPDGGMVGDQVEQRCSTQTGFSRASAAGAEIAADDEAALRFRFSAPSRGPRRDRGGADIS